MLNEGLAGILPATGRTGRQIVATLVTTTMNGGTFRARFAGAESFTSPSLGNLTNSQYTGKTCRRRRRKYQDGERGGRFAEFFELVRAKKISPLLSSHKFRNLDFN